MAFVCLNQLRNDAAVTDCFENFAVMCDFAGHNDSYFGLVDRSNQSAKAVRPVHWRQTEGLPRRLSCRWVGLIKPTLSERVAHKNGRYVRVITTITRILEKIFRSLAGETSMRVGLENVEGEVILLVWFIPITSAYLETLVYAARNRDIHILAPYHGIGIGIHPRMKDRIWANGERVYGTDSVAGKGKRIRKIKLPLSFLGRCVDAELKTVQAASAGALPGIGDRVLRKSALNDSAWGSGRVGQEMRKVPIRKAVRLS